MNYTVSTERSDYSSGNNMPIRSILSIVCNEISTEDGFMYFRKSSGAIVKVLPCHTVMAVTLSEEVT